MRFDSVTEQLDFWMQRRRMERPADFTDAVNAALEEMGAEARLKPQHTHNYVRGGRSPGKGVVADAIVRALMLGPSEELHLRRLWDGSSADPSNEAA